EANGTNAAIAAQVKPVTRASRDANQVAGLHFDCEDRPIRRMDVEETSTLDYETDFVFVVPMLTIEPGKHSLEIRRVWSDVDPVRGCVAAAPLQRVHLACVCAQ